MGIRLNIRNGYGIVRNEKTEEIYGSIMEMSCNEIDKKIEDLFLELKADADRFFEEDLECDAKEINEILMFFKVSAEDVELMQYQRFIHPKREYGTHEFIGILPSHRKPSKVDEKVFKKKFGRKNIYLLEPSEHYNDEVDYSFLYLINHELVYCKGFEYHINPANLKQLSQKLTSKETGETLWMPPYNAEGFMPDFENKKGLVYAKTFSDDLLRELAERCKETGELAFKTKKECEEWVYRTMKTNGAPQSYDYKFATKVLKRLDDRITIDHIEKYLVGWWS